MGSESRSKNLFLQFSSVLSLQMDELWRLLGQICAVLAFLIVGPAPFLPLKRTIQLVYISQVLVGIGMASQLVCGYSHALKVAV